MLVLNGVEVLDVREAAAFVDRTAETVRRWVWSGRVPAIRQGNRLFVARRDLEALQHDPPPITLSEWAAGIPRPSQTEQATPTASTLVLADRWADDHGR